MCMQCTRGVMVTVEASSEGGGSSVFVEWCTESGSTRTGMGVAVLASDELTTGVLVDVEAR